MSKINIIYLIPELKKPTGGAKVIYNHSHILNKLNNRISSQIIHLKKKFSYKLESSILKRIKVLNNKNLLFGYLKSDLNNEDLAKKKLYVEVEKTHYLIKLLVAPLKNDGYKKI